MIQVLLCMLLGTPSSHAAKITVPVDIGVGPAAHIVTGPIHAAGGVQTGLKMSVQAIIDKKTIKKHRKKIPRQYRSAAKGVSEVRFSPSALIPDTLFLSPKGTSTTSMWGISWSPVSVGVPLLDAGIKARAGVGLQFSYAYIDAEGLGTTHFLRPGLAPGASVELPFSKTFLMSMGWNSQLYIPQEVGGNITEMGALEESIWHIGQAFVKLHYRFPYTVRM